MTPDEFREMRERIGISKARLARLLGVNVVSVNRWESHSAYRRPPNPIACTVLRWLDQGFIPPGFATSRKPAKGSRKRSQQQRSTRADR